jgi:hypothetical protein
MHGKDSLPCVFYDARQRSSKRTVKDVRQKFKRTAKDAFPVVIPEQQSYFLLDSNFSGVAPLQNSRHKLGCLATSTILNLSPVCQAQFSLLPCKVSSPAWAPSAADCAAHAASPSPSAASGATSRLTKSRGGGGWPPWICNASIPSSADAAAPLASVATAGTAP